MRKLNDNSLADFRKYADKLSYPALMIDKDYIIRYKNKLCTNRLIPLRIGTCIDKFVSPYDFNRIQEQKSGEVLRICIELPALYGVFCYRGDNCCLLGIRTLSVSLQNRIDELLRLNSDLTESVLCQLGVLSAKSGEKGIAESIKNKSNRIIRSQQHISEFLRIVNGVKTTKTKVCDIVPILDTVLGSLKTTLRPLGIQIAYNMHIAPICHPRVLLFETDFNMILCLMINNAIRISRTDKIQVDISVISDRIYISILTASVLSEKNAKTICQGEFEEETFFNPDGWMFFELSLINKLCEYYLWDFKVSAPGSDFSRLQFSLSLPEDDSKKNTPIVRASELTKKKLAEIISLEFAELLDKT